MTDFQAKTPTPKRRPRRIRCQCCNRLMSYQPYKVGDAVRRRPPQAGICMDCEPRRPNVRLPDGYGSAYPDEPKCQWRGCEPASAVDRLAALGDDMIDLPRWPSSEQWAARTTWWNENDGVEDA